MKIKEDGFWISNEWDDDMNVVEFQYQTKKSKKQNKIYRTKSTVKRVKPCVKPIYDFRLEEEDSE